MKEIGILYSPILAEANRENFNKESEQIKTQTRRKSGLEYINASPDEWELAELWIKNGRTTAYLTHKGFGTEKAINIECPYGAPGDLHYVRERHFCFGRYIPTSDTTPTGAQKWKFERTGKAVRFDNNQPPHFEKAIHRNSTGTWYQRNARFMPKSYAQQWNMVRDIRVERLTDISSHDAIREGIECSTETSINTYKDYELSDDSIDIFFASPFNSFSTLISKIHTPEILKLNPWVWVIDYYPISTTGKPEEDTIAMWEDFRINIGEEWNKNSLAAICTRLKNTSNSALEAAKLQTV